MERLRELKLELSPRHYCRNYVQENGGRAELLEKEVFDSFSKRREFTDGPFKETFGDGYGEPYNPNRQAFGKLKNGNVVYCELSTSSKEKVKELSRQVDKHKK